MFYTYILRSLSHPEQRYIGYTEDLRGEPLLLEVRKKSRYLILAMGYQPEDLAAGRI